MTEYVREAQERLYNMYGCVPLSCWAVADLLTLAKIVELELNKRASERGGQCDDHC